MYSLEDKELLIIQAWKSVLNLEEIGLNDNFFDIGGDSLKALTILEDLKQSGLQLPFAKLFSCQTVREAAQFAEEISEDSRDLSKLMNLISSINAKTMGAKYEESLKNYTETLTVNNSSSRSYFSHYLITGGVGFLACHIAEQILINTNSRLTLLVRTNSKKTTEKRVQDHFDWYFPGKRYISEYKSRINIVQGDITLPCFGLDEESYAGLCCDVDCVVHAAAIIKHYGEWADFERANLRGTDNAIAFALDGRRKSFHHISTIAVAFGEGQDQVPFTEYNLTCGMRSQNPYIHSKILAENSVCKARNNGLDAKIYRMGFLVQGVENSIFPYGIAQENIFQASVELQLLSSLLKIGKIPAVSKEVFEFSFVDMAAKAIFLLAHWQDDHFIYHLFNEKRLSLVRFAEMANKLKDGALCTLPISEYERFLYDHYEELKDDIQKILLLSMKEEGINPGQFDHSHSNRTVLVLSRLGFFWPELAPRNMEHLLNFL